MDDMQFLTSPAIADVSGDGDAEIIQGSGGYLLRAFDVDGLQPAGWPKFTHGWLVASPAPGDIDGDGLLEVVAATREGNLYIWETPRRRPPGSVQWQGFGGDRRNSKNWSAGLATPTGRRASVLQSKVLRHLLHTCPPRHVAPQGRSFPFTPAGDP